MNLNDMKIGDLLTLCATLGGKSGPCAKSPSDADIKHDRTPVLVCTDKRGVVFGYTNNPDARPLVVNDARMALYWSTDVGGVFGLADIGPTKGCKISATAPSLTLEGITAVFGVTDKAVKAWLAAPVQGR